jgi:signal transduction histidine kinase
VLQELGISLEEIQVASEEIQSQSDRLSTLQETAAAIVRHQQSRFELAPLAYLVTDGDGMIREANRAAEILFGVLDLAKMQTGHFEAASVDFDLVDVVEGTMRSACAGPMTHDVEVGCRIEPDVPRRVVGDPHGLVQVVENLLGNALKLRPGRGSSSATTCFPSATRPRSSPTRSRRFSPADDGSRRSPRPWEEEEQPAT